MKLERRALGNTGLEVPLLSLGTVKFGRNTGVKYPSGFELPSDKEIVRLLEIARDAGMNLIDTAPAYGTSETRLGRLLPGSRDDWLICTKAGESFKENRSGYDFSGTAIEASVRQSLVNLRTDYLDMVLIHSDGADLDILNGTDAVESLTRLKDQGLIRLIGMSTKTVAGGLLALDSCDVLMVTCNLQEQSQLPVIHAAADAGRGILVKKALASGHADAAASLAFVLDEPGVHSVIVGTINPNHLQDNIAVAARAS